MRYWPGGANVKIALPDEEWNMAYQLCSCRFNFLLITLSWLVLPSWIFERTFGGHREILWFFHTGYSSGKKTGCGSVHSCYTTRPLPPSVEASTRTTDLPICIFLVSVSPMLLLREQSHGCQTCAAVGVLIPPGSFLLIMMGKAGSTLERVTGYVTSHYECLFSSLDQLVLPL